MGLYFPCYAQAMCRRFTPWILVVFVMGCGQGKIADGSTDGAAIYQDACARCHGFEGIPDKGMAARTGVKPLTSGRVRNVLSDEDLIKQIMNGSKSKTMPAFQGALSDAQVTALVAHLRELGAKSNANAKP